METKVLLESIVKGLFHKAGLDITRRLDITRIKQEYSSMAMVRQCLKEGTRLKDTDIKYLLNQLKREMFSYDNGRELIIYELYKKIADIPGHIVEVGVFRGWTSMIFGYLRKTFADNCRNYYGFDTFCSFPSETQVDEPFALKSLSYFKDTSLELVKGIAKSHGYYFMDFVKGDVVETIPEFMANHPDFKIALLYMDCDCYLPTKVALKNFIPVMQSGGIIVFDDYNNPEQLGETRAADEMLKKNDMSIIKDPGPISAMAYCRVP